VAEAGTGKSRLVYEFKRLVLDDCRVLEAYSVSYGKASAYLPVLELLYRYFGIEDADDKAERRTKIESRLAVLDPALNDTLPLLYTLMGLHEGPDPSAQMDPQIKRRRIPDSYRAEVKMPVYCWPRTHPRGNPDDSRCFHASRWLLARGRWRSESVLGNRWA
jgi:hypothetical protein